MFAVIEKIWLKDVIFYGKKLQWHNAKFLQLFSTQFWKDIISNIWRTLNFEQPNFNLPKWQLFSFQCWKDVNLSDIWRKPTWYKAKFRHNLFPTQYWKDVNLFDVWLKSKRYNVSTQQHILFQSVLKIYEGVNGKPI